MPQQGCTAYAVCAAPARSASVTASRSSWRACTWTRACTCTSLAATARRTCWTARRRRLPRSLPPVLPRLPSQAALTCTLRQAGPWTRMLHWHQEQAAEQRTKQKSSMSQSSEMAQAPTRQRRRQRCQRPSSIREAAGPWRGKRALAPRGPIAARNGLSGRREPCAMAALRGRARAQRLARATEQTGWAVTTRALTGPAWAYCQLCVCAKILSLCALFPYLHNKAYETPSCHLLYNVDQTLCLFLPPWATWSTFSVLVACGECWRGGCCGRLLSAMLTCGPLRAGQPRCRCRAARHLSC